MKIIANVDSKKTILVFIDYYLPGSKGGGPIRSLANIVERLSDEFSFKVVTSDHDLGDQRPYSGIEHCQWVTIGRASVFYVPRGLAGYVKIMEILRGADYDAIYLNSFFSRPFSIYVVWLLYFRVSFAVPVLLAPRGEFGCGALEIKTLRKRLFLSLAAFFCLHRRIHWHASSVYELGDIRRYVLPGEVAAVAPPLLGCNVMVAPDLYALPSDSLARKAARLDKKKGELFLIFVARIVTIKNLDYALRRIGKLEGVVNFDIYGPIEDEAYWDACSRIIDDLPPNVRVKYKGAVPHEEVFGALARSHLYILPTKGENFGHGILEALICGCPVLISDQTYWRGLADQGVGWDLPLNSPSAFEEVLDLIVEMDNGDFSALSARAQVYAQGVTRSEDSVAANRGMFRRLLRPPVNEV
jgi:glycosyltransferase involved in cell wall biosynthesis